MPYQVWKFLSWNTHRGVSSTAILFGSLSGGLTLLYVLDNSTEQLCGKQQAQKKWTFIKLFQL